MLLWCVRVILSLRTSLSAADVSAQALTGPEFLARSSYGPYFLYASFTAFACIVTFFTMKETRGASLET